jgi:lauroyl/myristoyl acyltransferase
MVSILRTLYYLFFRCISFPLIWFPRSLYALAWLMALVRSRVGYVGKGKSRASYLAHMSKALPELKRRQLSRILRHFWYVHQCNFLELFYLPRINASNLDKKVEFVGLEHLEEAQGSGRGVVLAAHYFGNERVIHLALGMKGYPVHVLSSRYLESPVIVRRLRLDMAEKHSSVHFPEEGPMPLVRALRQGSIVQYSPPALGDVDAVELEFLQHRVMFSTTPVRLAIAGNALLTTAWVHRLPGGRFRIVLEPFLEMPANNPREEWTKMLAVRMEKYMREHIDEFYWMWLLIQSEETIPGQI